MSTPVKILHVFKRMGIGGAELRTLDVFRHIDRRRFQFDFCTASGLPGELDGEIQALGGRVHPMPIGVTAFPRRFRRLLREGQYDVVHSHVHFVSGFLLRLAAQAGTPVRVCYFRSSLGGSGSSLTRRMYCRLMHHWIDRYATDILAVSTGAMNSVWGPGWATDRRCRVIYDGLELSAFDRPRDRGGVAREFGFPQRSPLYIHVGSMSRPKNHRRLISIFAELLRGQQEARLLLVGRAVVGGGDNSIEGETRRRIAELGIGRRVIFCGQRSDVPRLLMAADLLIFPSLWEGLGDAVLEASAAGTPTLASDLPSIREMAAHFPEIRCLSLSAPDGQWARTAQELAGRRRCESPGKKTVKRFTKSVFTVEQCSRQLCRVWEGPAGEPSPGGSGRG